MPAKIRINNFDSSNRIEVSALDADAPIGSTALTLRNNQGFAVNDYVLIGTPGNDGAEITTLTSVNVNMVGVVVPATKLQHLRYEGFIKLFGNQAKVYRASNVNGTQPLDASFAVSTTITLEPDQSYTDYTDATGGSAYWYKFTYYNSTSLGETNLADSVAVRGGGYGAYCSLDDIREEAGFKNAQYITDSMVDAKRVAAQAAIDTALGGFYTVPFTSPVNPFIADITRRLAAGYLLLEQYGAFGTLNTQNGQSKIDRAMADIKYLQSGQGTLKDPNGGSIAIAGVNGFQGWPNRKTEVLQSTNNGNPIAGSGDFMFRVNDRY